MRVGGSETVGVRVKRWGVVMLVTLWCCFISFGLLLTFGNRIYLVLDVKVKYLERSNKHFGNLWK